MNVQRSVGSIDKVETYKWTYGHYQLLYTNLPVANPVGKAQTPMVSFGVDLFQISCTASCTTNRQQVKPV